MMRIDDTEASWLEEQQQANIQHESSVLSKLNVVREQIDSLDIQIASLLSRRFLHVQELSKIKHGLNIPVEDNDREAEILERVSGAAAGDLEIVSAVTSIYKGILLLSRKLQTNYLTHNSRQKVHAPTKGKAG